MPVVAAPARRLGTLCCSPSSIPGRRSAGAWTGAVIGEAATGLGPEDRRRRRGPRSADRSCSMNSHLVAMRFVYPRDLVRLVDRLKPRALPVRPADHVRVSGGHPPVDFLMISQTRRRDAAGGWPTSSGDGPGGGAPERDVAPPVHRDPQAHEGDPREDPGTGGRWAASIGRVCLDADVR
jgi:hypothetical protein